MVDPLDPFVSLVQALARARAEALSREPNAVGPRAAAKPAVRNDQVTVASLRGRLRQRLVDLRTDDAQSARSAFVETVLLWQLGDEIAEDPQFGDLIDKVADQLRSERDLDARLATLLTAIIAPA